VDLIVNARPRYAREAALRVEASRTRVYARKFFI